MNCPPGVGAAITDRCSARSNKATYPLSLRAYQLSSWMYHPDGPHANIMNGKRSISYLIPDFMTTVKFLSPFRETPLSRIICAIQE